MFLTRRFYISAIIVVLVLIGGSQVPVLFGVGKALLILWVALFLFEVGMLWSKKGVQASRACSPRFSNGDDNEVTLNIESSYAFPVHLNIIDEIPVVFQRRDINFKAHLPAKGSTGVSYTLRPTERGVYGFGRIRLFARTILGLVERRFSCGDSQDVTVYPSFKMLSRYELLAINNNLTELGIKRIRRVGNNTEFDQIKPYVQGDDYRTINWKATARVNQLMVNIYTDERSQQVYNLIDKGRVMQQAFEGMTLLDYAINASLVLSYVAVRKEDKAGIITFDAELNDFVQADKRVGQMNKILECLYGQETDFSESDYSSLCVNVSRLIGKRSLLVLYTSFSDFNSMKRQLPYLLQLNNHHRLLVVFFEDEEMKQFIAAKPQSTVEYFQQAIAEKVQYERRLIVRTLREQGIYSLLTTPKDLSVDVINKYLDMKSRQLF